MANIDRRRKAFHYRHAVSLPAPNTLGHTSLQKVLTHILRNSLKTIDSRCYYLEHNDNLKDDSKKELPHLFVANYSETYSLLCMELMYVEPGTSVPIIDTDYEKDSIESQALPPPSSAGIDSMEYLDSFAHVAIIDNNVVIMQSKSISIKDIEEYINYLIKKSNHFGDVKTKVYLQSRNYGLSSTSLKTKSVKSINLTVPLAESGLSTESDDGIKLLGTLIGDNRISEIRKNIGKDISDLKIDISFNYKYSTSEANQRILREIAQDLIDSRDEDMVIELKGAGRIIGDDIQIKDHKYVNYANSLPVKDNVYEIMANWLIELLDQGIIEP